jgi:hypothetical protein
MQKQQNDITTHWSKLIEALVRDVPGLTFIKKIQMKPEDYDHPSHGHINRSAHVNYKHVKSPEQDGEGDWIHQDICDWVQKI